MTELLKIQFVSSLKLIIFTIQSRISFEVTQNLRIFTYMNIAEFIMKHFVLQKQNQTLYHQKNIENFLFLSMNFSLIT